jgi:multidrug efflux pump subunit AcrA (membrane-fusion protein)
MLSRNKKIIAGVVVVALVAGGLAFAFVGGGSSTTQNEVIVYSRVQSRTLQDTVTLNGTLARKQIRNVTAATQGLVSAVYSTNDSTTQAGKAMFAINGRDAIAEDGTVPFFRSLAAGDQGEDVLQLKKILAAAGDYPGPLNNYFNQQTEFALAQWQAQHHYPNSTPANPESVNVSLEQGTGYKLGAQDSAGLIIGPPAAQTTAFTPTGATDATLASYPTDIHANVTPSPVLTIQSVDDKVAQGEPANFVISASVALASPLTVNLTTRGTAGSQDIVTPPTSVTLAAGATSASVAVQTRANTLVEQDPTVIVSIAGGAGYTVGTPGSAQTTITNNNVPALQITGGTTITPGGSATLTVTANQAPLVNTQVALTVTGSAQAGTDYDPVNPVLTLGAGSTSASVTINTLNNNVIEPNKYIVVSITPSPASYSVTSQGTAVVTINGSAAQPTVTLTSPTTYLQKGEPYQVDVGLSQAVSAPLTVHLTYGGTAVQGTDFTVPQGNITVPAGQTALQVAIPTVTNNVVESNRLLTVSLASGTGYLVGTPSSTSVTITSSVVPTLTISANASTIVQGGAASFTITANQAPVKDTSVSFAVQGTAQPGQSYVPLTGTALLKAGQTQVTVVLQSIQNNVVFEPTDMIVGHWPIRVGQVNVKAGAPVAVGEAILSLTEPNLSVTLQATAAERSKLKVGQQCTVQIAGENTESSGVITELDATPTEISGSSGQSQQVYEGRIEVSGLNGADGSQVSINVVDQQVNNALTVPISAVKQNGSGGDVVRVVNLKNGKVTEVPVTTGLTEGSYIQITKGLRLGQVVISQVNQSS